MAPSKGIRGEFGINIDVVRGREGGKREGTGREEETSALVSLSDLTYHLISSVPESQDRSKLTLVMAMVTPGFSNSCPVKISLMKAFAQRSPLFSFFRKASLLLACPFAKA